MRLVGFITEYENIIEAEPLSDALSIVDGNDVYNSQILSYLDKGELVFGWMSHYVDLETGEWIAPKAYYTDGYWVWPSFYPYYLRKNPSMKIEKDFLDYLISIDFVFTLKNAYTDDPVAFEMELSNRIINKVKN